MCDDLNILASICSQIYNEEKKKWIKEPKQQLELLQTVVVGKTQQVNFNTLKLSTSDFLTLWNFVKLLLDSVKTEQEVVVRAGKSSTTVRYQCYPSPQSSKLSIHDLSKHVCGGVMNLAWNPVGRFHSMVIDDCYIGSSNNPTLNHPDRFAKFFHVLISTVKTGIIMERCFEKFQKMIERVSERVIDLT